MVLVLRYATENYAKKIKVVFFAIGSDVRQIMASQTMTKKQQTR